MKQSIALLILTSFFIGCQSSARGRYWGQTVPPKDNVLRYVTGPEPETLDPHISFGQPEARIYGAIFDGLVDYHPKTLDAIPALAESWEISPKVDEFIFYLRRNAKWSDGTPITAKDFVYSIRRAFDPETLSKTANLGYPVKYAEAFNAHQVFIKKDGEFLLEKDFGGASAKEEPARTAFGQATEFNKFLHSPARLTMDADEKKRAETAKDDPKLKAALDGAEFIPVSSEDIGVEAIDDYTVRLTLRQSAPYFLGLLAHQFFRPVPQHVIEKHGKRWTRPENIVTSGPFKVKTYKPYDILIVEKDPIYWDASNVHLNGIEFFPVEDKNTTMNLYKAGAIHASLNHIVPSPWVDEIKQYKDEYMNFPENACAYYSMNIKQPPFDNLKVRQAFNLAMDRAALSEYRKVTKPLYELVPGGIFPEYDKARARVSEEIRKERNAAPEEWKKMRAPFDPERARQLLTEAGFPVKKEGDGFAVPNFPTDKVELTFNTNESNKQIAEFIQAQWKRNLGITVPLKNMEFKTFLPLINNVEYNGFAQSLWSGDYMDPFTFLELHYGKVNQGGAGFYDPKYVEMLNNANLELDPQRRFEKLARAEFYLMEQQPIVPLTINATNWMKKPFIKGIYPNPGSLFPWKFVYIEHDPAKWDTNVENIMDTVDPQVEAELKVLTAAQETRKQNAKAATTGE